MRNWLSGLRMTGLGVAGLIVGLVLAGTPADGQGTYKAPRSPYNDGSPDLSGIWMVGNANTANWNLEDHPMAEYHPDIWKIGALFGIPAGQSVVDGGTIPYKPEALATKKEKWENRLVADVYKPPRNTPNTRKGEE